MVISDAYDDNKISLRYHLPEQGKIIPARSLMFPQTMESITGTADLPT
jgi:hypothetical protein